MSIRLRRSGLIAGALGGGVALVTIGAGLAMAQPAQESLTVDPTSGPSGAAFVVSGTNCDSLSAQVVVSHGDATVATGLSGVIIPPPIGTGAWSVTFDFEEQGLEGETLGVSASCIGGTTTYAPATYSVTDTTPPPTDPPPTDPPPTDPPATDPPATQPPGTQPGTTAPGGTGGTTTTTASSTTPGTTPVVVVTPRAPAPTPATPDHTG